MNEDLGSFKGPIIPFGAQVEFLPNSERDKARIHLFGKKVFYNDIFIGYALIAEGIWKGDILIDWEGWTHQKHIPDD